MVITKIMAPAIKLAQRSMILIQHRADVNYQNKARLQQHATIELVVWYEDI